MAELLLLHHAQGLTPGVLAFAERMRAAGHTAHVPDLYGESHLFTDDSLPSYDPDAAAQAEARVLELLAPL